jgi:allantoinase
MSDFDLSISGGTIVKPDTVIQADLGIADGKIAEIGPDVCGRSRQKIVAEGLHILPGFIDSHVHFNEPGRTEWEGFETGTRALAAGGGTMFFDMPLNSSPPTIDAESFRLKLAEGEKKSLVDFALWGGLVPGNLDRLGELADRGVVGFKAFMCNSGMDDFPCTDEATLREGMKLAAQLQLPVVVHAESEAMTRRLGEERLAQGRTSVRDYLDSRPVEAELDAIRLAIELAGETSCALHIVHVSCGKGVQIISDARRSGVNVSCETCPHYLLLTEEDAEQLGPVVKCAPPLRSAKEQEELWQQLTAGEITTVGSDHSPSPPEMKQDANFFKVWGGISGIQHALPLLLTEAHVKRGASLPSIAALVSRNVAQRFKLPHEKGQIEAGKDADLVLVDLGQTFEIKATDLLYRHAQSPYVGRTLQAKVLQTILRGQTIFENGKIVANPAGRLVKPQR